MPTTLLRQRDHEDSHRVAPVELFFDLVFVFAVTQLSHTVLADMTPGGLLRVLLLTLAVWWVWIYTTWVTNWLDPDQIPVRLCLFVLMMAGLLMSVSIPRPSASADRLSARRLRIDAGRPHPVLPVGVRAENES